MGFAVFEEDGPESFEEGVGGDDFESVFTGVAGAGDPDGLLGESEAGDLVFTEGRR